MKWQLLNTTALVRKPADETGSGGEGGEGGEGGAPGEGGGGDAGEGGNAGDPGAGDGGRKGSLLDYAPKGKQAEGGEGGEEWKLPDGVDIPEHLVGTDAETTLAKIATAYRGARQELSTRGKADGVLEGEVPKDLDGYTFEGDTENDPILKDLTSEESKPIVDAWRAAAKEVGIPNTAFAKFMQMGMKNMTESGLTLTGDPEQAAQINGEAEMEALEKAVGKAGADQMLRQIDTYAQKLAEVGILTSKEDVQEFGQMVGTAKSMQLMNRIIVEMHGEKPIPRGDAVDGAPTLAEAYEQQNRALSMPKGADRDDAIAAADKALEKAMAGKSSTTGQLRSRVL